MRTTIMSILLCVLIAWVTFGLLFVGLGLIFLLIIEHTSNTLQVMAHERSSDQAPQLAKPDLAVDKPVRKARELADACNAFAQLEGAVTSASRDAIPTAHRAVADRTQHTGAVIIRDPRLSCACTLSDQSGVGLNATFVFPAVCGGRDTAA
jgi:hypothetical protein